jgi:hypothetical protein
MDEIAGDRLVATVLTHPARQAALWNLALVTDVQALSASYRPLTRFLPMIERLRQSEAGHVVLESSLPEIRCLAMVLASLRAKWDDGVSPDHFADEADWLAARAHVLSLSHVEVTLERLGVLDLANRRLARLASMLGIARQAVLPVLRTGLPPLDPPVILRALSNLPPESEGGSGVVRSLRLRCRERLAPVLAALASHRT